MSTSPDCHKCGKFFGTPETDGLCSGCCATSRGNSHHIAPSVPDKRRQMADLRCAIEAMCELKVLDTKGISTTLLFPIMLFFIVRNNIPTYRDVRILLGDRFLLAKDAHKLISTLERLAGFPLSHLYHHVVFSHVLDTWNIREGIGRCYYGRYGAVPSSPTLSSPTFDELSLKTNESIRAADVRLAREETAGPCYILRTTGPEQGPTSATRACALLLAQTAQTAEKYK